MPFALALLVIDTLLIVHAAKTGRLCPWAYVILAIPGAGAAAYVVLALVPEWLDGYRARAARQRIRRALDPERRYRALHDELAVADTIANRAALAQECLTLGLFDEAMCHYEGILAQAHGDEPAFMLGKARAEFGLGRAAQAVATLDALRARWPYYESGEGHLLYARALEACGREREALDEYDALARYYAGAEPRVRHALLLRKLGHAEEADALLARLLAEFRRAPKFVRKARAEWISVAAAARR